MYKSVYCWPDHSPLAVTRTISGFLNAGVSPFVILWTKAGSGSNSRMWKCSTALTDFSDCQFLNQVIYRSSVGVSTGINVTNSILGHLCKLVAHVLVNGCPGLDGEVARRWVFL